MGIFDKFIINRAEKIKNTIETQTEKRIVWTREAKQYWDDEQIKPSAVGDLFIRYIETSFGPVEIPMYF